ncbi:MAG: Na+/H+ antiporter subunit E [Candidatus Omnitrophota bacterium]|nr:Na+/H+ antiporter subunit E [Candidatus Omnitrophota bacterium]
MMLNLIYFILWFSVWSALRRPIGIQDLILGALVALFVTFVTADLAAELDGKRSRGRHGPVEILIKVAYFLYYVIIFLWECVKANIDVAFRVLHPDLPIRPGTVKIRTALKSDAGLTFLANSLTLTPGNTTVDVDKLAGVLYVHRLYIKDERSELIPAARKFENILKRIFE